MLASQKLDQLRQLAMVYMMNATGIKDPSVKPSTFHQTLLSQAFAELRNQYSTAHKLDDLYNFHNVQYDEFWDDLVAKLAELMYRTN